MQDKKQQLELDMKQQTDLKLEKEYVKAVYCHLAYLTYLQNAGLDICFQNVSIPKRKNQKEETMGPKQVCNKANFLRF